MEESNTQKKDIKDAVDRLWNLEVSEDNIEDVKKEIEDLFINISVKKNSLLSKKDQLSKEIVRLENEDLKENIAQEALLTEEKKNIENQEKKISLQENIEESQKIEETRWQIEDRKKELEQQRWEIEKEIESYKKKILEIDDILFTFKEANEKINYKQKELIRMREGSGLEDRKKELEEQLSRLYQDRDPLERKLSEINEEQASNIIDLNEVLKKETLVEEELKIIEERESQTSGEERRLLESERMKKENERREIKKEKWELEKKKGLIEEQLKIIQPKYDKMIEQEQSIENEIAGINEEINILM